MNPHPRAIRRLRLHILGLSALVLLLPAGLSAAGNRGVSNHDPLPKPLTLSSCLEYALGHNPDLLAVREQIREQEGLIVQARARQLPSLAASGGYTRLDDALTKGPEGMTISYAQAWTLEVTASQVIYSGGAITSTIAGQRERAEAARLQYAAAVNDTVLSVRLAFMDVILNHDIIRVREEALNVLQAESDRVHSRRAAGTGSDFDVLRADVAVANARPALIHARNAWRNSEDRLAQLLGAPDLLSGANSDLAVQGDLDAGEWTLSLEDSLSKAAASRPELLRQDHLLKAAGHAVTAAKAGYQPTLAAYVGYEWERTDWVPHLKSLANGYVAGVKADWAIFDGRATAGKVQQARSQERQLHHGMDSSQLAVAIEVRKANTALVEARELLEASQKVVEQAQESLRLARVRFDAGAATHLDILQAQSAMTEARYNLTDARHAKAAAVITMQRAVGNELAVAQAVGQADK